MQFLFVTYAGFGCLLGLSTFESARQEMLHYTGFTVDVVHCCELELATTAVEAALQTVAHLAASPKLQDALLKAGVIWSVVCAWSCEYFISRSVFCSNRYFWLYAKCSLDLVKHLPMVLMQID